MTDATPTPAMTPDAQPGRVKVTQADRDAEADRQDMLGFGWGPSIRAGEHDDHLGVQSYARHRLTALAEPNRVALAMAFESGVQHGREEPLAERPVETGVPVISQAPTGWTNVQRWKGSCAFVRAKAEGYEAGEAAILIADAMLAAAPPSPTADAMREALAGLLAVVDKMDLSPSAGGGVLPVDKALATHAARAALAGSSS